MTSVTVNCPHTVIDEDGEYDECNNELEVLLEYDSSYGADADGNRGMGTWFGEDIIQEHCQCVLTSKEQDLIYDRAVERVGVWY